MRKLTAIPEPSDHGRQPFRFIMPIRHPAGVKDSREQLRTLATTIASLDAQIDRRFDIFIACDPSQVLPEPLPRAVVRVDVELAPVAEVHLADLYVFHEAIRHDKGARVAAAFEGLRADDLVMVADDDDLVSRSLVAYALQQPPQTGLYVANGFIWRNEGDRLNPVGDFHRRCGTSLVVRADKYAYFHAGAASSEAIRELGSHKLIFDRFQESNHPFAKVPFAGGIYRLGHGNATEVRRKQLRRGNLQARVWRRLTRDITKAVSRRFNGGTPGRGASSDTVPLTAEHRAEFFGETTKRDQ